METEKPYQILLRGTEKKKMNELISFYEKSIGTKFTRADIIRIAFNKLYDNVKSQRVSKED